MTSMPTIKSDAATLSADFGAHDYVGAGFEAGEIAKTALPLPGLAVGFDCELTDAVEADYLAGFIKSFTGNDHSAYLETCFKPSAKFSADMWADWEVVKAWYRYWMTQGEMKIYQTAYTNVLHNMPTIKTTAGKIDDDWRAHNYTAVGEDAGAIAKLALPVVA